MTEITDPLTVQEQSEINIAIISDLHCHLKSDPPKQESYLIVGSARIPANQHPIESLLNLIYREKMTADILICAGDVSHRASLEGLSAGFAHLLELETTLKCSTFMCALGNHDIDFLRKNANDPFYLPQSIHSRFPVGENNKNQYWSDGFSIVECNNGVLLIVLNTVADHIDERTAKRGTFANRRLEALDKKLAQYPVDIFPLRIATLHHHPMLHTNIGYEDDDVVENGDSLMNIFAKHSINLIIHGHRHQPRIRRHSVAGHNMVIFAAGSFSAFLTVLSSTTRNLFHKLTITRDEINKDFLATLKSWEYNHGQGWNPTTKRSSGLPFSFKFSGTPRNVLIDDINSFISKQSSLFVTANELYSAFPQIEYALPEELDNLGQSLERNHKIKFNYNELGLLSEIGKVMG